MDKQFLMQHLAQAEAHIAQGRLHIERQEQRIAELERDGHDSSLARTLLDTLGEAQRLHEATRERILAELSAGADVWNRSGTSE
jgi:hypothetical protein